MIQRSLCAIRYAQSRPLVDKLWKLSVTNRKREPVDVTRFGTGLDTVSATLAKNELPLSLFWASNEISRHESHERIIMSVTLAPENLEIIREEQCSPAISTVMGKTISITALIDDDIKDDIPATCPCPKPGDKEETKEEVMDLKEVERLLTEKENQLQKEFDQRLEKEINLMKDRFDFILQNEQIRASYMLREAHRERQEKISALQTQLECKNLAGLMYVLCSERRKSKLEKLRLVEDYSNYINVIQEILLEGQALILHLSRGYKTAARLNHEWQEKMKNVIKEFQSFVYHYAGGTPESNQYFFDMPKLLQVNSPVQDNPDEDPCDEENILQPLEASDEKKTWWERLEDRSRPFVVYGDMAEFTPNQRRETLKHIKATKTAPKKWKEYVFNNLLMLSGCPNADVIKNELPKHQPIPDRWECQGVQTQDKEFAEQTDTSRRITTTSVDIRGNMGSILKIITSNGINQPTPKSNLLGARDSMEIASTTKLREAKHSKQHSKVVINVKKRRTSFFNDIAISDLDESDDAEEAQTKAKDAKTSQSREEDEEIDDMSKTALGSAANDSLEVISNHVPDVDHRINYEKVCPMDKCTRLRVDSFARALPTYMRSNPFLHFEQTFEHYEACSPDQLEILKQRIENKKKKERSVKEPMTVNPLAEWSLSVEGVGTQTSDVSVSLPPCTCRVPEPSPVSSADMVYKLEDLIPVKQVLNKITKECLYDSQIEFDRFKVVGQESSNDVIREAKEDFAKDRIQRIRKILKQHPSLCDIFQANTQC